MKQLIIATSLISASLLMNACTVNEENGGISGGGGSSTIGVVSHTNFTLLFGDWALQAFDPDAYSFTESNTDINVHAADRDGLPISGQTIYIRTEWGVLSAGSCVTNAAGDCSVTWTTSNPALVPGNYCSRVVAYTTGEEAYFETNINDGTFDSTDAVSLAGNTAPYNNGFIDLSEPYYDTNQTGSHDSWEVFLDVNGNGSFNAGDGLYNGSNCSATGFCSATTSTTIWLGSYIDLKDETKAATPAANNTCAP